MNLGPIGIATESPSGEVCARPYETEHRRARSLVEIKAQLDDINATVLSALAKTFLVAESGTGTQALLDELRKDYVALQKAIVLPAWATRLDDLRVELNSRFSSDQARDRASLASQPKNSLRELLATPARGLSPDYLRVVRAARGLLSLKLISGGEQITADLADEVKRWLVGKGPEFEGLGDINIQRLWQLHRACSSDDPRAKLLMSLIEALQVQLVNPFKTLMHAAASVATRDASAQEYDNDEKREVPPRASGASSDPLRGLLAEAGKAGVRIFSGVPTYRGLHPKELEVILPIILRVAGGLTKDEVLATVFTLLSRVLPTRFGRISFSSKAGAGIWIDLTAGHLCINLDEVIASHGNRNKFVRSPKNRFIRIPLPSEVIAELRFRANRYPDATTLDQLFDVAMANLAIATKSMLRSLAVSSHRPTLTHLSRSWARLILSLCNDEAYASALGLDFTVGTTANFNYVVLRGRQVSQLASKAYRLIGLSGDLSETQIEDVGSRRRPDEAKARAFVQWALNDVGRLIRTLPKRTPKRKLMEIQNEIAPLLYGVLKLISTGRELKEETLTGSRIDLVTGLLINTDKRIAPYHERRLNVIPATLRRWLQLYLSWLQLLAYRLQSEDRVLADAIATILDLQLKGDFHPLFFCFADDGNVAPLGAVELSKVYAAFGIKNNGGRHFLDWLFRSHDIDSAAIMAAMGRGNPGQEGFGSWSTAIPLDTLTASSEIIEGWLNTLSLVPPPNLKPRPLPTRVKRTNLSIYIPELLKSAPDWTLESSHGPNEPCPFGDAAVILAAQYERIFRAWRGQGPPDGWLAVALSLIFEDGVHLSAELDGVLHQLYAGSLYREEKIAFCDARCPTLGIRRVWLSESTLRLIYGINEPPAGLISSETLDPGAKVFLKAIVPEAFKRGLKFIMACAAAYCSLRVPGVLHGWMRGFRFARTSRPETVARHLIGTSEHLKFDTRRRHRSGPRALEAIKRVLRRSAKAVERGASHATVLSRLDQFLTAALARIEAEENEGIYTGYLLYLARTQSNFYTVVRYESGARRFLEKTARALEEQGPALIDWRELVSSCIPEGEDSDTDNPAQAAINHALEWLGVDLRIYRRTGPPPAAFIYAEMPSAREVDAAIRLLEAKKTVVADEWHLAAVGLRLLNKHPHRWDALAHLRVCDVALEVKHPHIVITREAGAALKSDNAQRVLFLEDTHLIAELKTIWKQRVARFPGDRLVYLFGDDDDPRSIVTAARVHALIDEALFRATGSPVIRPHDVRDAVISRSIAELIDVREVRRPRGTLAARQGMYQITIDAGQSAPDVPTENYGHGLDMLRRDWVAKLNLAIDCPPSTKFISRLTGVPAATYRQRYHRTGESPVDMFDNFDAEFELKTGAKVMALANLVSKTETSLPWELREEEDEVLIGSTIYVGLRLLSETQESARLASCLSESITTHLENGLSRLNRRRPTALLARGDINRDTFVDAVLETGLPIAMNAASPPSAVTSRVCTAMDFAGDPWNFASPEDVIDLSPWISVWKANEVDIEVSIRPTGRSALDEHVLDRLRDVEVRRPRVIPARHFKRGARATLKCMPTRDGKNGRKARASPQICFLVTSCAIAAVVLSTLGDQE